LRGALRRLTFILLEEHALVTRLSSRGQLVLPKEVRDRLGWTTGTEIEVEDAPDGVHLRLAAPHGTASAADLLGCTGYKGPRRTIEEMDAAVGRAARLARKR
jgi:AbrB family looped-hinge helix DNA binding protein